jgi:hypothetical protein
MNNWKEKLDEEKKQSTIIKLKKLHDSVKEHPYRLGSEEKYLKSYIKLLDDLMTCFYWVISETIYKKSRGMLHDFRGAIYNLGRKYIYENEALYFIEMCIGVIHEYLETGDVLKYFTFYTGQNILKSLPRLIEYSHKLNGEYKPKFTQSQVKNALDEIKNHYKKFPPEKWDEFGIYSKEEYDFLKNYSE